MKIWITGCAGFLGARLAREFSSDDHKVVGLSRRASQPCDRPISIDLASPGACKRLRELGRNLGYPDVVVHAASLQPDSHRLFEYVRSNALTTANLLDALEPFPPQQLIYTSSLAVYGRPDSIPVQETDPLRGNLPYAVTKRWSEQLLEAFQGRCQVIILRLPSLYGAGQDDSFVDGLGRLARRNEPIELFGCGKTIRDALHVGDVVAATVSCVKAPPPLQFACMNLGCGEKLTTHDYARALVNALGSTSSIIPVDREVTRQAFDLYADIGEAGRQIGFKPTPLGPSMERYAHELQSQR